MASMVAAVICNFTEVARNLYGTEDLLIESGISITWLKQRLRD